MMAVHWYPERRHRLEDALLRHYHEALADAGVRGSASMPFATTIGSRW